MNKSENTHNQFDDTNYVEEIYQESIKERAKTKGIPIEQMKVKMDGMFNIVVLTNPKN